MKQIWMTALAGVLLVGFAALVSAAAITSASVPDGYTEGRARMVEAQYRLARILRR